MYDVHQPFIAEFAKQSPESLHKVFLLAVCSQNQKFHKLPLIMTKLLYEGEAPELNTRQVRAIEELWHRREEIYERLRVNWHSWLVPWTEDILEYLISLPSIGMVKGGFICQMVFGTAGCLDTHNQVMYSFEHTILRTDCTLGTLRSRIREYIQVCERIGSATLWNTWCTYIAAQYPRYFENAEQVSELHVRLCLI